MSSKTFIPGLPYLNQTDCRIASPGNNAVIKTLLGHYCLSQCFLTSANLRHGNFKSQNFPTSMACWKILRFEVHTLTLLRLRNTGLLYAGIMCQWMLHHSIFGAILKIQKPSKRVLITWLLCSGEKKTFGLSEPPC